MMRVKIRLLSPPPPPPPPFHFTPNLSLSFPLRFRQIQLAKTDACPLSSSEREALSECRLPAHFLRQLFQWQTLTSALRLGLTCKGLFTLYRGSLATDRRSLVLNNGCYFGFEEDTDVSPFFADHLSTLLFRASNRVQLVNSAADEESYFYTEEDVPLLSWGDRLFRRCLPRLTGLTSLTLVIDHQLAKNLAQLSTALYWSVATTATTTTSSTSSTSTSTSTPSPPLSQLTTLRMICYLELTPAKEEEEKARIEEEERDLSAIMPLQLPALTHLTVSLHGPKEGGAYQRALRTGSSTMNAFRVLFRSPLLFAVLPQLSSLQLHSDLFAGKLIRSLRRLLWRIPQLLPTPAMMMMMSATPPALQLSFNLTEEEEAENNDRLVELVKQLGVATGARPSTALAETKQALAFIVQLRISSSVDCVRDWSFFSRLLSALLHLKRLALSFDRQPAGGRSSSLPQLDILATLRALSSLPALEEVVVYGSHPANATKPLLSRPDLLPQLPVLAPLRRLELHLYAASCAEDPVEHLQLAHCFPRLEELTLVVTLGRSGADGRGCERHRCRQPPPPPHSAAEALNNGCFRQLFASLLDCPAADLPNQTPTGRWVKALRKKKFSLRQ